MEMFAYGTLEVILDFSVLVLVKIHAYYFIQIRIEILFWIVTNPVISSKHCLSSVRNSRNRPILYGK